MKYVEALLQDLRFQVPDAADPVLERHLRLAISDFLRDSELWVPEIETFYALPGGEEHQLPLAKDLRIARVQWVTIGSARIPPLSLEDLQDRTAHGYYITDTAPHGIRLGNQTPGGWAKIGAAVYPTPDFDDLPEGILDDFHSTLVAAAVSRIYSLPGSAWFNAEFAFLAQREVDAALLRAKRLTNNRRRGQNHTVRYGGI